MCFNIEQRRRDLPLSDGVAGAHGVQRGRGGPRVNGGKRFVAGGGAGARRDVASDKQGGFSLLGRLAGAEEAVGC